MDGATLSGGFTNAPIDAAKAFRQIMDAMARPGRLYDITGATPPAPLSVAAGTALLTLCDADTPVYLAGEADTDAVRGWLAFHTSAPIVQASEAMFAVGSWSALHPIDAFSIGTPEYPDRSATLIVEMPSLAANGATLRGPGIKDTGSLGLPDVETFARNHALFPLGLDFLFTSGSQIAALPRSTEVS